MRTYSLMLIITAGILVLFLMLSGCSTNSPFQQTQSGIWGSIAKGTGDIVDKKR